MKTNAQEQERKRLVNTLAQYGGVLADCCGENDACEMEALRVGCSIAKRLNWKKGRPIRRPRHLTAAEMDALPQTRINR